MQANDTNLSSKGVFDAFLGKDNFRIKIESVHDEHPEDAILRRFKDRWLFLITLFLILATFMELGFFIVFHADSPQVGTAISSGMGLVMALTGYYVRGKNN